MNDIAAIITANHENQIADNETHCLEKLKRVFKTEPTRT